MENTARTGKSLRKAQVLKLKQKKTHLKQAETHSSV